MRNEILAIIETYTPTLPATRWAAISSFVRASVRGYTGREPAAVRLALTYMSRFADWVAQTAAANLGPQALQPEVIDVYTVYRSLEVNPTTAQRERKVLRALAGIRPAPEQRPVTTVSIPERPYTETELTWLRNWATWQPGEQQRRNCIATLTLGVGCGLRSAEVLAAGKEHLRPLADGGLGVHVTNGRERTIPVMGEWADLLEQLWREAPEGLLVAPGAANRDRGTLTRVLKCSRGGFKPTPQRLRATWLDAHLRAGTRVDVLLAAAGLTSVDSLKRPLRHLEELPPAVALSALRIDGGAR